MSLTETPSSFRSELLRKSETIHHGQSINRVQEDDTLQIRTLQQLNDPPEVKGKRFNHILKLIYRNNIRRCAKKIPLSVAEQKENEAEQRPEGDRGSADPGGRQEEGLRVLRRRVLLPRLLLLRRQRQGQQ